MGLMNTQLFALATALAAGSLMASDVRAQANRPLIPEIVDVTHATKKSAAFFHSLPRLVLLHAWRAQGRVRGVHA